MAKTDMHYIYYDPDEVWKMIQYTYIAEGGDILYPGSEKEILLRSVLYALTLGLSIADNRLLMDSLRFANGEFLDIYGEKRNCYRIEANAAKAEVEITFSPTNIHKTIPAGTALTADGQKVYLTTNDIEQTGLRQAVRCEIVCTQTGAQGNGLASGTVMQFVTPNSAVESIIVTRGASGGRDKEEQEHYRERIREYGLTSITTGPKQRYEQVTRSVSTAILDAKAVKVAACSVCVYIISEEGSDKEAIRSAVLMALNEETERPLTDLVTVSEAEVFPYTLNVKIMIDSSVSENELNEVVNEYKAWQDNKMARPFNPDRLMAMLYTAGANRVTWGEGSNFNGNNVEYTQIGEGQRCLGNITLSIVS